VTKATRAELDTGSKAEFRVTRKLGVCFAVVQEVFGRKVTVESRENVLCCDTMTCAE